MGEAIRASIDGNQQAPAEATISVLDDGLLRGDGAFEAIKLYGGRPFRLEAHLDRLARSAAAIELAFDREALESEVAELLDGFEQESMLRIVITRGGRRILLLERLPDWPAGVAVALVELSPSEILGGVKSISYAANMQATRIAQSRGAGEAVYVRPDGVVLEAPTSSIFWVSPDGELRTPSLQAGILDSITRQVVLEQLEVREGELEKANLLAAQEAFLASTTREIQPITEVDGTPLPTASGPVAAEASAALRATVERELGL